MKYLARMSTAVLLLLALFVSTLAISPERGLLDVLGLKKPPKVPQAWRTGSASTFLLERFQPNGPLDVDLAISFPDKAGVPGWLWFDLENMGEDNVLLYAEIRIHLSKKVRVTLIDSSGSEIADVDAEEPGWLPIDVANEAERWLKRPIGNLGLAIEVRSPDGSYLDPKEVGLLGSDGPEKQRPFMVAYFGKLPSPEEEDDDNFLSRHGRSAEPFRNRPRNPQEALEDMKARVRARQGTNKPQVKEYKKYYNHDRDIKPYRHIYTNKTCSMYPFYVNFKDLNWHEWMIAPAGFEAGVCYGQCHAPFSRSNNHALIQSMMEVFRPAHWPKTCCVPIRLKSLNVLYFDDNKNVVLKTASNMIVSECGCR